MIVIKKNKLESIKTMMNLGCEFFVEAEVEDISKVNVDIGMDTFVEMKVDEAIAFSVKKEKELLMYEFVARNS